MTLTIACACGQRHAVTAMQAGTELSCVCGRRVMVPSLTALKEMSHGELNPPALDPAKHIREFQRALVAFTPHLIATPAIVVANLVVFAVMVASGVHFFTPTAEVLVDWGADFGPKTMDGQWWRLVTSMFLHSGVLHLGLNMWVLWDLGRLVERLVGNVGFVVLYFVSGIAGSVMSLAWKPIVVSVGASGAIFGVAGALLGLVAVRHETIPIEVLKHLRTSMLMFVMYNMVFGFMVAGIDVAAHIGGLATGFVCGLILSQPLSGATVARRRVRNLIAAAAGAITISLAILLLPDAPADIVKELERCDQVQEQVLSNYNALVADAQRGVVSDDDFAQRLERDVLPAWNENRRRMQNLLESPQVDRTHLSRVIEYVKYRGESWRMRIDGLREQDSAKLKLADEKWEEAEKMVTELLTQQ